MGSLLRSSGLVGSNPGLGTVGTCESLSDRDGRTASADAEEEGKGQDKQNGACALCAREHDRVSWPCPNTTMDILVISEDMRKRLECTQFTSVSVIPHVLPVHPKDCPPPDRSGQQTSDC